MDTRVLAADSSAWTDEALRVLRAGGLIAFPTDTVYGLGALAFDEQAVQSIYAAKGRSEEKAIPVLLGDFGDIDQVAASLPPMARRLAERFWPGPLTLVVRRKPTLPAAVSSTDTIGVRVPDHVVARALLRAAGPMAVTSANRSGEASSRTASEVISQLSGRVALVVDGGVTPGGVASTVLDCTNTQPRILRQGPITLQQIQGILG